MLIKNIELSQKQLITIIIFGLILLTLIILSCWKLKFPTEFNDLAPYAPIYSAHNYPLPVLLDSPVSINFILENRKSFKQDGLSGFIISTLPSNWNNDPAELNKQFWTVWKLNWYFRNNYLRTSIAEKGLPVWDDLEKWTSINQKIKTIARFARQSGFKGLVIDTTAYDQTIWAPEWNDRYKSISEDFARKVIYQRGREIIENIESEFPKADIS